MKSVIASFVGTSKDYEYFVPKGDEPEVDDLIVTSIAPGECIGNSYRSDKLANVARIVKVLDVPTGHAKKFYLQLLQRHVLLDREDENKELLETEKRKAAARAALERKVQSMDRMAEFEKLAAVDPEAAQLLKVLKGEV